MPVGHLRCAAAMRWTSGMKSAVFLERRIDQDEAAALLRRHIGAERRPAVDRQRLGAAVAAQCGLSAPAARGSSSQAIRRSCGRSSVCTMSGRARISAQRPAGIERGDRVEIRRQQSLRNAGLAATPPRAARCRRAIRRRGSPRRKQIVAAGAGMGVDDAKRRRLESADARGCAPARRACARRRNCRRGRRADNSSRDRA